MSALTLEAVEARVAGRGRAVIDRGMLVATVDADALVPLATWLKTECAFDLLLDVTAVDWPREAPRFEVVYHFYSTVHGVRVRVKTRVPADIPVVATLTTLYGAARFAERECHDMYGIVFRGNDDLRPILLYEGFVGHPLRKDYPKDREQPLVRYRE